MQKKSVAIIFGGCTVEHDVSIVTGLQLIENMNKERYDVTPIYISSSGEWFTGEGLLDSEIYKDFSKKSSSLKRVLITPIPSIKAILHYPKKVEILTKKIFKNIDVVVPAIHGMNGEDGTLQGLIELANIPYVGSGVLGSAVGMDKIVMKAVFAGNNLPVLKYTYFLREEWADNQQAAIESIENKLKYPVFVKPSNLGSSIGITKAKDRQGLIAAIEVAIHYDRRIIVEEGVEDILEINCSVLGFGNDLKPSVCEQPVSWEDFLTFDDKYMRGSKSKVDAGMSSMDRRIPAPISDELTAEIQQLAVKAFRALDCRGVSRIDFIVDKASMKPFLNEINTIPGSFSFYLWEPSGIKYSELIDKLVDIAIRVNEEKNKNIYTYDSNILSNVGKGAKMGK